MGVAHGDSPPYPMLGSRIERIRRDDLRRRAPLLGVGGKKAGGGEADEGEYGENDDRDHVGDRDGRSCFPSLLPIVGSTPSHRRTPAAERKLPGLGSL